MSIFRLLLMLFDYKIKHKILRHKKAQGGGFVEVIKYVARIILFLALIAFFGYLAVKVFLPSPETAIADIQARLTK